MRLNALGKLRRALQALDILITRRNYRAGYFAPPVEPAGIERWRRFLSGLETDEGTAEYLATHAERLARTLELVPETGPSGRALELGCYMQMTPALGLELGYEEVRGGYYGPAGGREVKSVRLDRDREFHCEIDLFDAERDRFPYPGDHFDCVLACEIIEHLKTDPMHMMAEIRRVLRDGGALVLTTPNCASLGSVTRVLHGFQSPQVYSCYPLPGKPDGDSPHVREYTPFEVKQLLEAAGFRLDVMLTDRIGSHEEGTWAYELLERNGFGTELRGEQIYCRAIKDQGLPVSRYPSFLYEG